MSPQKADITLCRSIDGIPVEASDEEASDFLSQKMHEHGFKVYVRKPDGASVFENGFPQTPPMHPLQAMPFPSGRVREEIAKAKLQGHVIDYGLEEPEIRFLELDSKHVLEIASKKVAKVHWFAGGALRAAKRDAEAAATSGLIQVPPCLRCLRPSNDFSEMKERYDFGGALKEEAKFSYEFRIHDIFVCASDLGLLKFATYRPSKRRDPFGIYDSSPAVYWAYRAAKEFHVSLVNRTKKKADVIRWLREKSPSLYKFQYIADQIFKAIDPYHRRGRGSEVPPFNRKALVLFRALYPDEEAIHDGLALIISASIWWSKQLGRWVRTGSSKEPPASRMRKRLGYYGFYGPEEIQAISAVIRGTRGNSLPEAKTKSEKRLPMQVKSRRRKTTST